MTTASPTAPRPKRSASAVSAVRNAASKAADTTASNARDLARQTAAGIEANPVAALAVGIAVGLLAGSLIPRSESETKLLRPVGKRLSDTARGAFDAARDTAKSEFDLLGLTRDAARGQVGKLLGGVVTALTAAGSAALTARLAAPSAPATATPEAAAPIAPKKKAAPKKAKAAE